MMNTQPRDNSEQSGGDQEASNEDLFAGPGSAVSALTHELVSPLNDMHALAHLMESYLRKKMGGDKFLTATVHNLTSEISRLKALLEEFRLLMRPGEPNFGTVDVQELIGDFLLLYGPSYRQQGIQVQTVLSRDCPPVTADRSKLREALQKLFANAAEAMPEGGTLTIRGWSDARCVHVQISDTGMGIPQGLNIFEPFVTTKPSGTGLGLTIARRIIAAHGGTLAYSNNPGAGATFTVSLPRSLNGESTR